MHSRIQNSYSIGELSQINNFGIVEHIRYRETFGAAYFSRKIIFYHKDPLFFVANIW